MSDIQQLLHLLRTGDSLFPSGTYAHSFGLEGLVEEGWVKDAESLQDFIRCAVVPTLLKSDLPFVREAHRAAAADDLEGWAHVDVLCHAQRSTKELRELGLRLGEQRLVNARTLFPHAFLDRIHAEVEARRAPGQVLTVSAAECATRGIEEAHAAAAAGYQALSGIVSASMKLLRIGQQAAQQALGLGLEHIASGLADTALIDLTEAGWFNPLTDVASARHERAYTRLFIS